MASQAKITAPRVARIHARERLFGLLDAAQPASAVWIWGPPGAGKTTLAVSYLKARGLMPMWCRLDEGDADPATFFHNLAAAAQQARPRSKQWLPRFTPEYRDGIVPFARRFFRGLFARLPGSFALVLDNYHDLGQAVAIDEAMQQALLERPDDTALVVVSRNEPPAAFARQRANGGLVLIGGNSLRLADDEARAIASARDVPHGLAGPLIERSNGWCAGLVLLCELPVGSATDTSPATQTPQALFDYFAAEILRHADASKQDVLMACALMPAIPASAAEALSGHAGAAELLESLARSNYFTVRDTQSEPVYEFHPLFRAFLLARGEREMTSARLRALKIVAARLLQQHGAFEAAVDLLRSVGESAALASVIRERAPAMLEQGRHKTLHSWFDGLPPDLCEQQPWLLYFRSTALLPFDPAGSQPGFERAFDLFVARHDREGLFLAWCGIVNAIRHSRYAHAQQFGPLLVQLDPVLAEDARFPSEEIEYQVTLARVRAAYAHDPQHRNYALWRDRLHQLCMPEPYRVRRAYARCLLLIIALHQGDYAGAQVLRDSVVGLPLRQLPPVDQNAAYLALAYFDAAIGNVDACLRLVTEGLAASDASGVRYGRVSLCAQAANVSLRVGDLPAAAGYVQQMAQGLEGCAASDEALYHFYAGWLALVRDEPGLALTHARASVSHAHGWLFIKGLAQLILCRALWRTGECGEARAALDPLLAIARRLGGQRFEYAGALIRTEFALEEGGVVCALPLLRAALAIGRAHQLQQTSWFSRAQAASLMSLALEQGIEPDYSIAVIRALRLPPPGPDAVPWPWSLRVSTLGGFALQVDGRELAFVRKAPKKPIAVLKALMAMGGRDVPQHRLLDAIWPDEDGDAAEAAFNMSLHRLRKLLGHSDAVLVGDAQVTLNAQSCFVDARAFERLSDRAEGCTDSAERTRLTEVALGLYRGPFLPADTEEPWSVSLRERLRARFVGHVSWLAGQHEGAGHWPAALECYQRGIEADDLAEQFYQGAIRCYRAQGRNAEGLAMYRRLRQVLSATLGIAPSPASQALHDAMLAEQ